MSKTTERTGFKPWAHRTVHRALDPVVSVVAATGVTPNHLSVIGFLITVAAGGAFAVGASRVAASLILAGGITDILDGQVARKTGRVTRFGAFFDSTLDRAGDALILIGIAAYYVIRLVGSVPTTGPDERGSALLALLAALAIPATYLVSYTRARAEGLGVDCNVGWFERPERLVLLTLAGLAGYDLGVPVGLAAMLVLSSITALHRVVHVWTQLRDAS